ncbi:Long-chain-fatty-acid--CoA ligase [Oopsacas minuta]|uniref:long-chain-fatty-acid--CoA ligase n=1 Tax=Oopsacas minuta TaxID=111878 RepID=A0AAV7JZD9_9METZ|nr:Long-chain-fatty-acid--CoA ligase [Oopsacas minuta]
MAAETPANWVTNPSDEVVIQVGKDGVAALPPRTIPDVFKEKCDQFGAAKALNVKRDGKWQSTTFTELYEQCMRVAKSLLAVGLKRFEGVSIMGFNSPEWIMAELGTIMAGGLATGIYTTNNVETTKYILENSGSRVAIGEHSLILEKLLEAGKGIEGMKFVQYSPVPVEQSQRERGVISWEEFLQLGKDVKTEDVEAIISTQKPGQCSVLVYTSGTTGMPKGVMLSHDNLIWTTITLMGPFNFNLGDPAVSYLPFSHIAGQILDIIATFIIGLEINFAQPDALKGTLVETLKEVEPVNFLGVPRVWEKMKDKIEPAVKAGKVPLPAVKKILGLGKGQKFFTAAAPTPIAVLNFFETADCKILNVYGTSENSGPACFCLPDVDKTGSVGKHMIGTEVKLHKPNSEGEGELCLKGRHIFMGYLKAPEKTKPVMDADSYYHTGDLAKIDSDGFVWITGRIKELIVTSGGENIAPVVIEDEMKKEILLCAYFVVVGDGKNYLNMLVTLKSKLSPAGIPTDDLDDEAVGICKSLGVEVNKISEAKESVAVKKYIQDGINRANERAISNAAKVQKFAILPLDLSIAGDELTPTAKLKRSFVINKYADVIAKLYA